MSSTDDEYDGRIIMTYLKKQLAFLLCHDLTPLVLAYWDDRRLKLERVLIQKGNHEGSITSEEVDVESSMLIGNPDELVLVFGKQIRWFSFHTGRFLRQLTPEGVEQIVSVSIQSKVDIMAMIIVQNNSLRRNYLYRHSDLKLQTEFVHTGLLQRNAILLDTDGTLYTFVRSTSSLGSVINWGMDIEIGILDETKRDTIKFSYLDYDGLLRAEVKKRALTFFTTHFTTHSMTLQYVNTHGIEAPRDNQDSTDYHFRWTSFSPTGVITRVKHKKTYWISLFDLKTRRFVTCSRLHGYQPTNGMVERNGFFIFISENGLCIYDSKREEYVETFGNCNLSGITNEPNYKRFTPINLILGPNNKLAVLEAKTCRILLFQLQNI
jgi:hypothetical protein